MIERREAQLPQFVEALVSESVAVLLGQGLSAANARAAGLDIARRICSQFGKQMLYIPSAIQWERTDRDRRMWDQYGQPGPDGVRPYTSARVAQIAAAENLSLLWVYTVLKQMREDDLASRQVELPGLDG